MPYPVVHFRRSDPMASEPIADGEAMRDPAGRVRREAKYDRKVRALFAISPSLPRRNDRDLGQLKIPKQATDNELGERPVRYRLEAWRLQGLPVALEPANRRGNDRRQQRPWGVPEHGVGGR